MQIVHDGWDPRGEEDGQHTDDDCDEQHDGERTRWVVGADAPGGDTVDRRREYDGEQRGDVDDEELSEEYPGNCKQNRDAEGEENVAANGAAGGCFGRSGGFGKVDQRGAPLKLLSGLDAADADLFLL
ncbi:hypothetical protein GCM10011507_30210 [Edaphobacter acidisoli]|uniref:Uncharacterized protein n=1 Tax=Edaphobacter acidisoli TaxID=2040573 RepID=A0A916W8U4_9BACT|nr:hypothetical protein GCM10011507_30210 [Edaphobacter acidisoli]